MDNEKKAKFVQKMRKKRLSLTKRQNFDLGGSIGGLLGIGGGNLGGTGFSTNPGATPQQVADAYNQNQHALSGQQNISDILSPRVSEGAYAQGVLSNQYAQQALGEGPNVAQTMLNQQTGNNVAQQAALMAGQRGASANPALLARQAGMVGAQAQQGAAGQAATLQAQQQIAAQQAQAQLASNQIAQGQGAVNANTTANQGEQGLLLGTNDANNQIQGQLAGGTLANQQKLLGGLFSSGSGAAMSAMGAPPVAAFEGGEIHGPKKLDFIHKMTKLGMEHYHGPENMADGGLTVAPQQQYQAPPPPQGGSYHAPSGISASSASISDSAKPAEKKKESPMAGAAPVGKAGSSDLIPSGGTVNVAEGGELPFMDYNSHFDNYFMSGGGKVKAMVSPGEIYLDPNEVQEVVNQNMDPAKVGKKFSGKPKVKGDSEKNDVIKADLDEGGVVIKRSQTMSPEKRKSFVRKSIAKKKAGGR